jgi:RNA polymerase sigma-70 factor (ECF subfamily)
MSSRESDAQARNTADAVARRSYGKLVAFVAARTRDVAAAEDALSEAFASALTNWPLTGCPANPEAWLLTVARRKVIDVARRRRSGEIAAAQLQVLAEELDATAADVAQDIEVPDQRLALMFACAHPAIDPGIRAPLILQVVLGLDASMIASAWCAQRTRSARREFRFASPSAKSFRVDSGPYWTPYMPPLRRVGRTQVAPTSPVAICPRKLCSWGGL